MIFNQIELKVVRSGSAAAGWGVRPFNTGQGRLAFFPRIGQGALTVIAILTDHPI